MSSEWKPPPHLSEWSQAIQAAHAGPQPNKDWTLVEMPATAQIESETWTHSQQLRLENMLEMQVLVNAMLGRFKGRVWVLAPAEGELWNR